MKVCKARKFYEIEKGMKGKVKIWKKDKKEKTILNDSKIVSLDMNISALNKCIIFSNTNNKILTNTQHMNNSSKFYKYYFLVNPALKIIVLVIIKWLNIVNNGKYCNLLIE
ncbi:hypothetical protein Mgra_00009540 [Meloidogyne graminicola]|uniref:Uncharacterized protein n=1 Tax=Meloidogyne graminicola TaxID=189291 RepID=A0A8S9Z937_9BILA|nr:hypothetical protein Mgra_00009540 [Meloidogyne graminicola]